MTVRLHAAGGMSLTAGMSWRGHSRGRQQKKEARSDRRDHALTGRSAAGRHGVDRPPAIKEQTTRYFRGKRSINKFAPSPATHEPHLLLQRFDVPGSVEIPCAAVAMKPRLHAPHIVAGLTDSTPDQSPTAFSCSCR